MWNIPIPTGFWHFHIQQSLYKLFLFIIELLLITMSPLRKAEIILSTLSINVHNFKLKNCQVCIQSSRQLLHKVNKNLNNTPSSYSIKFYYSHNSGYYSITHYLLKLNHCIFYPLNLCDINISLIMIKCCKLRTNCNSRG